jgi:hypothetical protein
MIYYNIRVVLNPLLYLFLKTFDYIQKVRFISYHFFQRINLLNKLPMKFDIDDNPVIDLLATLALVAFVVQYRIPPVEGALK